MNRETCRISPYWKAWRHFVNQLLSRRLPEVPNPNSQIPGKTQSPNRKRSRGFIGVLHFGTWDLILYLGFEAWDLGPAAPISSLSVFIPRWGDLEVLA
jgi:hypothetical protein